MFEKVAEILSTQDLSKKRRNTIALEAALHQYCLCKHSVAPVSRTLWRKEKKKVVLYFVGFALKYSPLTGSHSFFVFFQVLTNGGGCDSPGYCVQYCTHTIMDSTTRKIVDNNSNAMEKEGYIRLVVIFFFQITCFLIVL